MAESFGFSFEGKNALAQRAAGLNAAKRVTAVNRETERAIRKLIVQSIAEGIPPYDAARLIRSMVGMNRPQIAAAMKYRAELIDSGLSQGRIDRQMARYTKRKIAERAVMIARTEILSSLAQGQELSYKKSANVKKRWLITPVDACPICVELNGQTVAVTEPFQSSFVGRLQRPTAHPHCRCAIQPVPMSVAELRAGKGGGISTVGGSSGGGSGLSRVADVAPKPKPKPKPLSGRAVRRRLQNEFQEGDALAESEKRLTKEFLRAMREPNPNVDHREIGKELTSVKAEIRALDQKKRKAVWDLVKAEQRSDFEVLTQTHFNATPLRESSNLANQSSRTARLNADRRDAVKFVQDMVGKSKSSDDWVSVTINTLEEGERAFYRESQFMAWIAPEDETATIVHELGHYVEYRATLARKARLWRNGRAAPGETVKSLGAKFGDDEVALWDKFIDPYVGKSYQSGATEVVSMGLEYLYKDPIAFMKKDPDMFDFLVDLLREVQAAP